MLIYFIIILLLIIGIFFKNPKIKKYYYFLICLLIFLVSSFRNELIGNDTIQYLRFFDLINGANLNHYIDNGYFEVGYIYINYFIKLISDSKLFFLTITSAFIYFGIFRFIYKNSKNEFMSLLLFVLLLYFFESMSAIRQYLAISIILLSFDNIRNKKLIKYIISVVLALLIHKSAIICILLYFVYNIKIDKKTKFILLFITLLLSLVGANFISSILLRFNFYTSYLDRLGTIKLASFIGMIINILIYLFVSFRHTKDKESEFFINVAFISMLLSILTLNFSILGRLSLYFEIFSLISIVNSIFSIKTVKNRLLFSIILLTCCFSYMYVIVVLRPDWYMVFPYMTSFIKG